MTESATAIEGRGLFAIDGQRVRELRQSKGWTQLELSLQAGLMQSAVSRLEKGLTRRVQWATLERLSSALGEPIERLQSH
jgi:transcriptional regulator with XRE-family HTH domain